MAAVVTVTFDRSDYLRQHLDSLLSVYGRDPANRWMFLILSAFHVVFSRAYLPQHLDLLLAANSHLAHTSGHVAGQLLDAVRQQDCNSVQLWFQAASLNSCCKRLSSPRLQCAQRGPLTPQFPPAGGDSHCTSLRMAQIQR